MTAVQQLGGIIVDALIYVCVTYCRVAFSENVTRDKRNHNSSTDTNAEYVRRPTSALEMNRRVSNRSRRQ